MTKATKIRKLATVKALKEVPKDPNQRAIKSLSPTRVNLRKSLAKTYYPIDHHIYYDGSSFRVRVRIDGETFSVNTPDKMKATKIRNRLLKKAGKV
jgi:hypothetical protein